MNPEDIRDVKVPLAYPDVSLWIILGAFLLVCMMAVGALLWWRKRHPSKKEVVIPPKPWAVAIEALNVLVAKDYLKNAQFDLFYAELSDILRRYVEDRFLIRAPEMTTEEFLISLKDSQKLNEAQKNVLKGFLESADMVKFAKYSPSVDEAKEGYTRALAFVDETTLREEDDI